MPNKMARTHMPHTQITGLALEPSSYRCKPSKGARFLLASGNAYRENWQIDNLKNIDS
jgi:hypothetical protein